MSQTQLDDLTAGAGDGANLGLITNVLGNKGGEGRWESMRLLSAGVFGLEIAALSPQRERPIPSSPHLLPPSGQSPPTLWFWSRGAGGVRHPHPCSWGHALRSDSWSSVQHRGTSLGVEVAVLLSRMGHSRGTLSQEQDGDHWRCCHMGLGIWESLLFPTGIPKFCCYSGTRFAFTAPCSWTQKHPAAQQPSPPQPITSSISWRPAPTAPSAFPSAVQFSILHTQTLPLGKLRLAGGTQSPLLCAAGVQECLLPPASLIINFHQWPSRAGAAQGWPRNTALSPDSKNKYIKILAGGRRMREGRKKLFYNL